MLFADCVKETSTSSGTGSFTLSGTAAKGYQTFAEAVAAATDITDGGAICIRIEDTVTGDWEVCDSTFTVATNIVTRGTLRSSSLKTAGAYTRVSFALTNTKHVYIVAPAYLVNSGLREVVEETPSGTMNGVNTTFTLANTPSTGKQKLYQNSTRLFVGLDYTISGAAITMTVAPLVTDYLRCDYNY